MKQSVALTIASLLSIVLGAFHLADDIDRGMSPGGLINLLAVLRIRYGFPLHSYILLSVFLLFLLITSCRKAQVMAAASL